MNPKEMIETKIDNRIKIRYQVTADEKIKVISFNLLNDDEIKEKFGDEVYRLYFSPTSLNKDNVYAFVRGGQLMIWDKGWIQVNENDTIDKEKFQNLIKLLKKAGKRLSEIIKSVKNYEIKEIII